jgi:hypothetical protein
MSTSKINTEVGAISMKKHSSHKKDISKLLASHAGQWVALDKDESKVLGSGRSIDTALKQAFEKGESRPMMIHVPAEHSILVL